MSEHGVDSSGQPGSQPGERKTASSVLQLVQKLKEQIREKDQEIGARASALRAARDYLEGVFAALADAVLVVDAEGGLEFVNPAAQELLGWRAEELLGRPLTALIADPDQAAQLAGPRWDELVSRPAQLRTELSLSPRAGEPIPVSAAVSVLLAEGQPPALVLVARDVRAERRLEEEKLRAVRALAASVAHEIRNPLGAIQSAIGLLRRDLGLEGEDKKLLDIVVDEAERMGRIVTRFLEFARPSDPVPEPADLGALVRAVVTLAEHDERARARAIALSAQPAPLECDPAQVKQVVWNLLTNALDAARSRVAVFVGPGPGGGAEVRVEDDGQGIASEVLARAGEPFRTTKAQGTGLGLAISRRIVEAHGGTLSLVSIPGGGTTAAFTLPASPRQEGAWR